MKINLFILSGAVFIMICLSSFAHAQEDDSNLTDEFAIELLYKHFESHYTPKDVLHKAQKEALYIAQEFKKSDEAGKKAIDEFNHPFSRWNQLNGLHPWSQIHNTDKGWIDAHPNPKLHKIRFIENLHQKFKDHSGRLVIVEMFEKVNAQPKGGFISQYTSWIKSESNINQPMYLINAYARISGTPHYVVALMPYRAYSLKEMDITVKYLNAMVEFWSIIE